MDTFPPVNVAVSPVEKFREYLAARAMRFTQERETIVDEVFSDHDHFDREQLVDRLTQRKDGTRVSRASVHRTVSLLEEAGLIRKVARHNDREVYEHDYGYPQHDHLICEKCGQLIEFRNQAISELLEKIAIDHDFLMSGHRLEVSGVCKPCRRPPDRRHRKLDLV